MTDQTPTEAESGKRYSRDEDLKPAKEGEPPRPATEPGDSGTASENASSMTDPVTGRPNEHEATPGG